jgi:hypothetical protein
VRIIKPDFLIKLHEDLGDDAEADKAFVYKIARALFGDDLKTHSLMGSKLAEKETGNVTIERILDAEKLNFAFDLLRTRVRACGINDEDRTARSERFYFNVFIRMLTDTEHKKKKNNEKNRM